MHIDSSVKLRCYFSEAAHRYTVEAVKRHSRDMTSYYHDYLDESRRWMCMQYEIYRAFQTQYENSRREWRVLKKLTATFLTPLERSAQTRMVDDAFRRQLIARRKMTDLAELILCQPRVRLEQGLARLLEKYG